MKSAVVKCLQKQMKSTVVFMYLAISIVIRFTPNEVLRQKPQEQHWVNVYRGDETQFY